MRDKVVVVTGAASGMGRAIAHLFAGEGAQVAVTDRAAAGVDVVVAEIAHAGGVAAGWALDVADAGAIVRVVDEVAARLGPIDILVNDAGVSIPVEISAADFERRGNPRSRSISPRRRGRSAPACRTSGAREPAAS